MVKPICEDGEEPREASAAARGRLLGSVSGYLVVDHHVDCAVRGVGRQVRQVEGLVHDALARERSIAVQQDGHHLSNR